MIWINMKRMIQIINLKILFSSIWQRLFTGWIFPYFVFLYLCLVFVECTCGRISFSNLVVYVISADIILPRLLRVIRVTKPLLLSCFSLEWTNIQNMRTRTQSWMNLNKNTKMKMKMKKMKIKMKMKMKILMKK